MQPASPNLAILLAASQRTPSVYVVVEYPSVDSADKSFIGNLNLGSTLILDGIMSFTLQQNEEASSDSFDMTIANGDSRYSPLRYTF